MLLTGKWLWLGGLVGIEVATKRHGICSELDWFPAKRKDYCSMVKMIAAPSRESQELHKLHTKEKADWHMRLARLRENFRSEEARKFILP